MEQSKVNAVQNAMDALTNGLMTFITVGVYIGIIVFSTTHKMFMWEAPVKLPLLNAEIPIDWFYLLAPWLVVILHGDLLVRLGLLADRLRRLNDWDDESEARSLPFSMRHAIIGVGQGEPKLFLFCLIVRASLVVLAPALLLCFLWQSLPFHEAGIVASQSMAIVLDLTLIGWLLPREWWWSESNQDDSSAIGRKLRSWPKFVLALFIGASLLPVMVLLTQQRQLLWKFRHLELHDTMLTPRPPPDEVINQLRDGTTTDEEIHQALKRVNPLESYFQGRDLQNANLSNSFLARFDLRKKGQDLTNLRGANLSWAQMQMVLLDDAIMANAHLESAGLQEASLQNAKLQGANLTRAKLGRATLAQADLSQAILDEATMTATNLQRAKLHGAQLRGADLRGANLSGSILSQADLNKAVMLGANLQSAELQGALLQSADLQAANLREAKLRGANLMGADLRFADLSEADLEGAVLSKADLRGAILYKVRNAKWADARLDATNEVGGECAEAEREQLQKLLVDKACSDVYIAAQVVSQAMDSDRHCGREQLAGALYAAGKAKVPECQGVKALPEETRDKLVNHQGATPLQKRAKPINLPSRE